MPTSMNDRRYFTVDEANAMVPWLEQCFGRILRLRSQMRSLYSTLEDLGHRPDPESLSRNDGSDEVQSARAKFVGLTAGLILLLLRSPEAQSPARPSRGERKPMRSGGRAAAT